MTSPCGGGGPCQSNCLRRPEEEVEEEDKKSSRAGVERLSIAGDNVGRCAKCGERDRVDDRACNGLCAACFRLYLFGKFKLAVTSNAMISPTDNLLLAFSGGPASRVALQFVDEMQCKSVKNWDASRAQALPVFGVGVAFIDESVFLADSRLETENAIEVISSIVSDVSPANKEPHIMPIESIFSAGTENGRRRLCDLLEKIADPTGKEDFLRHLRMLCLQKIAVGCGYSKVVLGSCTSGIARHIISATVKGQGYSLPADLHYVDARLEVPVVLPLRDCLAQELRMLCHLDNLKTVQLLDRPHIGINGLVSSFVSRLQDENPSRERTIVRTAEKLKPFNFNKFSDNGYHDFLPSRLRPKFQNVRHIESAMPEVLCPICGSPLCESEMQNLKTFADSVCSKSGIDAFVVQCCQSCSFQITPQDAASLERFYALLPQTMTLRVKNNLSADRSQLRDQIKDCLLSDDDGDDDGS